MWATKGYLPVLQIGSLPLFLVRAPLGSNSYAKHSRSRAVVYACGEDMMFLAGM